ncbi:hypothetical protein VaNZ11_015788 [Volvox africanus]|uniref:Uncharacterized protein n=1 Tax=Volvox africanus TaxID=51714 RepID=A0ABQ5SMY0_9CHLO|nr:hypothetical protein VaNZ11_015788 [Volvox africanus]
MKNVLVKFGSLARRHSSADGTAGMQSSGDSSSLRSSVVEQQLARLKAADEARKAREERLAGLNPFCIDATLVECLSTGQESVEDKVEAFKLLTQCGLNNIILASFVKERTPDLKFLQAMRSQKLIDEHCFAFSELFDANGSDLPGQDLPFGLAKMIQFGIQNAILECDLAAPYINWNKYSTEDFCALVESRCRWVAANLFAGRSTPPASFVHLRDFAIAMQAAPQRVLEVVEYLGRLDPCVRPQGILIHEPASGHFPFEAAPYVAAVRSVMDSTGWTEPQQQAGGGGTALATAGSGVLLVHVTAGYGLAHATVLECLAAGCSGVMASLCEEAEPASTHASSLLDLVNLSRLGNPFVAAHFDMDQLRAAAREISTTLRRAHQARQDADKKEKEAAQQAQQQLQQAKPAAAASFSSSQGRQPLILGHA